MAFVRSPNEKWQKDRPAGSNLYSEGTGGVAGGGAGAVSNQVTNTKAGNAAGWYNIQDFLGANKGNQTMQNQIRETGNQFIDQGKENMASEAAEYEGYDRPDVFGFDKGRLESRDIDAARTGLNQDYDPFDVEGAIGLSEETMSPYDTIESGNVQSLVDFNRKGMKPNAQYTTGMSMMDNALLGNDYDFVNNYANEFRDQFETQVLDPFHDQKDAWITAESERDTAFDDARNAWTGGVGEWLTGEKQKVDTTYTGMSDTFKNLDKNDYIDPRAIQYVEDAKIRNNSGFGMGGEMFIPDVESYLRPVGDQFAPTKGQAAYRTFGGQEGIDYFNALSQLYANATQDSATPWKAVMYTGGGEYIDPSYEYDYDAFQKAINDKQDAAISTLPANRKLKAAPATSYQDAEPTGGFWNQGTSSVPVAGGAANWVDQKVTGGATSRAVDDTVNAGMKAVDDVGSSIFGGGGGGGSSSLQDWRKQFAKTRPEAMMWTDDQVRQEINKTFNF